MVFYQPAFWSRMLGFRMRSGAVQMNTTLPSSRRVYRFGLFEADAEQGTLTRQGIPVKLQEQPFRVLALLLEAPGEILTRENVRRKIWPEGTYVEFDGSVNTALMKLRAALNDNAENPVFIETVPRKGYRFIAPVEIAKVEAPGMTTAIRIESGEEELDGLEVSLEPGERRAAARRGTGEKRKREVT